MILYLGESRKRSNQREVLPRTCQACFFRASASSKSQRSRVLVSCPLGLFSKLQKTVTKNGYIRIKTQGPFRDKYLHRIIIENLLGHPIPQGLEVHHQDGNPSNNCPFNLVLIDRPLHRTAKPFIPGYLFYREERQDHAEG